MQNPNALDAFVAASLAFTEQLTELRRMMEDHHGNNPDSVSWPEVGTVQADVATLRTITDRYYRRGEYATTC